MSQAQLPIELLREIFHFMDPCTLRKSKLTSKQWNILAKELERQINHARKTISLVKIDFTRIGEFF